MKTSKCMRMGLCATSATLSGVLGVKAKALYLTASAPTLACRKVPAMNLTKSNSTLSETVIGSESSAAEGKEHEALCSFG